MLQSSLLWTPYPKSNEIRGKVQYIVAIIFWTPSQIGFEIAGGL